MPTSDADVAKLQESVESKREQLKKAQRERAARESALHNDVVAANLKAEEARLDADLAVAKAAGKASAVKEGASAPLEQAKDRMRVAVERQKGQEALADAQADQDKTSEEK